MPIPSLCCVPSHLIPSVDEEVKDRFSSAKVQVRCNAQIFAHLQQLFRSQISKNNKVQQEIENKLVK